MSDLPTRLELRALIDWAAENASEPGLLQILHPLSLRRRLWSITTNDICLLSDINWVIMDYLVSEGYPGAAEKFAQETNICSPADMDNIRERVRIRNAIHAGRLEEAICLINELDHEVC